MSTSRDNPMRQPTNKAAGFSLIEALVSLIVISVGMIGIASLYGQGLTAGRVALARTLAVNLASAMAENIRANPLAKNAYAAAAGDNGCDPTTGAAICSPDQMAAHDLLLWNRDIQAQLPNGVGQIVFADGAPPTYTINVTWKEVGIGDVTEQLVVRTPDE
jgi:type IV pilus assembly protein PilV